MKRIIPLLIIMLLLLLPSTALAAEPTSDEYSCYLSEYDLSAFDDALDSTTRKALSELGLSDFDYNSITSLSPQRLLSMLRELVGGRIESPLRVAGMIMAFVVLSAFMQSFRLSDDDGISEVYSTMSALVIAALVMTRMGSTVSLAAMAISASADFIYAFIPAFCVIVAASGGITASFTNNSLLLMLSQALSFVASNLFVPVINCFLALGICSSLRYELHLDRLLGSVRKIITTCISVATGGFISILSLRTAVASRADALGLRSVRFAINSVVPVIGSAISEGLLSIQSYSSLISSSVGVVGIIAVALMFLPSITEVLLWRLLLSVCSLCSDAFGDNSVSAVLSALRDAMLLMNVILILSMVTTIISIGILIASSGG